MEAAISPEQDAIPAFDIVARRKRSKLGVASAKDFDLRYWGTMPANILRECGIVYCADFEKGRVFYTVFKEPAAMLLHPFLYAGQYACADRIACVPFQSMDAFHSGVVSRPNFVFSPGRCGSTLLAALLRACGLPTASEPDLMTQLAKERLFDTAHSLASRLQQVCMTSLADHWGTDLAVKLRSQCVSIALQVARGYPSAKIVFIMRERIAWARSRYRAFPGDPKTLAHLYRAAVNSYGRLCEANHKPVLLWYEDIVAAPCQVLERLAFEGLPLRQITAETVADIMHFDSQAGTHLDSRKLKGSDMTEGQIREFEDEWRQIRPAAVIEQYKLRGAS